MSATKLLAAKAVLAAVGLTGGGAALAAATGHLPSSLTGAPAATRSAASAAVTPAANGKPASDPASSPSPSLRGLCQAYTAHAAGNPGKALDNPAFSALITAAGGKDKVAPYCASLPATRPGKKPASHPSGKPASHPNGKPTSHPSGKPSSPPAHANTAHPPVKPLPCRAATRATSGKPPNPVADWPVSLAAGGYDERGSAAPWSGQGKTRRPTVERGGSRCLKCAWLT
jgi:hypothetical protein